MTSEDLKHTLILRWKLYAAILGVILALSGIGGGVMAWADARYDQRDDINEIRENVEFLTRLALEDRITNLDGRIQILENTVGRSRDDLQTLNELRLERYQLQRRLEALDGHP